MQGKEELPLESFTNAIIAGRRVYSRVQKPLLLLAKLSCRTAADQVVSGKGKFEEVIVASREIAASSMQLVMASRVKADKSSVKLGNLNATAKTISRLTGTVVATAENCRDKVAIAGTLDFSKLSLHYTKRMEMETLVKVLETEKQLDTERSKLSELRKHHYRLAGEIEGWEAAEMS
ncbi:hypothetical protein OTU49_003204 [Cherax quadricarinatus]|uniref:I/LWEQ domain-containing protein n=1 Tax=Cherax quadricarinatus TaxID=27406 RepID=A0AAW0XJ72_CHEQU